MRFRGVRVLPTTPLFFSNGMITHRWKRGVGVSPMTTLFAYTLQIKKNREEDE